MNGIDWDKVSEQSRAAYHADSTVIDCNDFEAGYRAAIAAGYELGRKETLADLRVVTSGMSYFALAYGPLYHTRESAAEALMKLRRPS